MIAFLHGFRLACLAALLIGIYEGSRLALVIMFVVMIVAQELTAALVRRVSQASRDTYFGAIARAQRHEWPTAGDPEKNP